MEAASSVDFRKTFNLSGTENDDMLRLYLRKAGLSDQIERLTPEQRRAYIYDIIKSNKEPGCWMPSTMKSGGNKRQSRSATSSPFAERKNAPRTPTTPTMHYATVGPAGGSRLSQSSDWSSPVVQNRFVPITPPSPTTIVTNSKGRRREISGPINFQHLNGDMTRDMTKNAFDLKLTPSDNVLKKYMMERGITEDDLAGMKKPDIIRKIVQSKFTWVPLKRPGNNQPQLLYATISRNTAYASPPSPQPSSKSLPSPPVNPPSNFTLISSRFADPSEFPSPQALFNDKGDSQYAFNLRSAPAPPPRKAKPNAPPPSPPAPSVYASGAIPPPPSVVHAHRTPPSPTYANQTTPLSQSAVYAAQNTNMSYRSAENIYESIPANSKQMTSSPGQKKQPPATPKRSTQATPMPPPPSPPVDYAPQHANQMYAATKQTGKRNSMAKPPPPPPMASKQNVANIPTPPPMAALQNRQQTQNFPVPPLPPPMAPMLNGGAIPPPPPMPQMNVVPPPPPPMPSNQAGALPPPPPPDAPQNTNTIRNKPSAPPSSSGGDSRDALLDSIKQGVALKQVGKKSATISGVKPRQEQRRPPVTDFMAELKMGITLRRVKNPKDNPFAGEDFDESHA